MTTSELRGVIASLQSVAPKLNKAADEATAVIGMVEKFLKENAVGLSTAITVDRGDNRASDDDDDLIEYDLIQLQYGRHDGSYRIFISEETIRGKADTHGGVDNHVQVAHKDYAWGSAPRELKLKAFPHVPQLLRNLAAKASEAIASIGEASSAAREIVAALSDPIEFQTISVEKWRFKDMDRRWSEIRRDMGSSMKPYIDLSNGDVLYYWDNDEECERHMGEGGLVENEAIRAMLKESPDRLFDMDEHNTYETDELERELARRNIQVTWAEL